MLLALLFLGGCTKVPDPPIRVGLSIWPGYEPLMLAQTRGFLNPDHFRLVEYTSATQVLRAFRNNSLEVAAITLDEVILLRQDIADICVIAVLDISNGADVVLGGPGIATLNDLRGKRVGYESTALGAFVLDRALEIAGIPVNDIVTIHVELDRHEEAFRLGEVDALVTYEPKATRLRQAGAKVIFDSTQIPGEIVDVLVARRATTEGRIDRISQLVGAWLESVEYVQHQPEHAMAVLSEQFGLSEPEMRDIYVRIVLADEAKNNNLLGGTPPLLESHIGRLAEVMLHHQLVSRPVDVSNMVDPRPLLRYGADNARQR